MKSVNKIICAIALVAGFVSCNKAEFITEDFLTFSSARYTVWDDGSEIKIPVSIVSDKIYNTTVTYRIETDAVIGEDYTLGSDALILNVSNAPGAVCDSIVIRTVDRTNEIQKNKNLRIVLETAQDRSLTFGNTSSCRLTILDSDEGINRLIGTWIADNLLWEIELLEDDDPVKDEFGPEANVKILKGAKIFDFNSEIDLICTYDDKSSELKIYKDQFFATGINFGSLGYCDMSLYSGSGSDVPIYVKMGELTFRSTCGLGVYQDEELLGPYESIPAGTKLTK